MRKKEDLRIVKTKRALTDAFAELIVDTPYDSLTVNDLCRKAGIRRATFYKHYKDKLDFLNKMTYSMRQSYEPPCKSALHCSTADYYTECVRLVLDFVEDCENLVLAIMKSGIRAEFLSSLLMTHYKELRCMLIASEEAGAVLPTSADSLSAFLIAGLSHVIFAWIDGGLTRPKQELLKEADTLICLIFSKNI